MSIDPIDGKKVKGIITITATKVPENTRIVAFMIQLPGSNEMQEQVPSGIDTDGNDGWSRIIDTTTYKNGVYDVGVIAGNELREGEPPLAVASTQIIIEN